LEDLNDKGFQLGVNVNQLNRLAHPDLLALQDNLVPPANLAIPVVPANPVNLVRMQKLAQLTTQPASNAHLDQPAQLEMTDNPVVLALLATLELLEQLLHLDHPDLQAQLVMLVLPDKMDNPVDPDNLAKMDNAELANQARKVLPDHPVQMEILVPLDSLVDPDNQVDQVLPVVLDKTVLPVKMVEMDNLVKLVNLAQMLPIVLVHLELLLLHLTKRRQIQGIK